MSACRVPLPGAIARPRVGGGRKSGRELGSLRGFKDSRFTALEARIQDLEGWIPPFFGRCDPFLVGERRRGAPERRKIWLLSAEIRDFPSKPRIQRPVFNPRREPSARLAAQMRQKFCPGRANFAKQPEKILAIWYDGEWENHTPKK